MVFARSAPDASLTSRGHGAWCDRVPVKTGWRHSMSFFNAYQWSLGVLWFLDDHALFPWDRNFAGKTPAPVDFSTSLPVTGQGALILWVEQEKRGYDSNIWVPRELAPDCKVTGVIAEVYRVCGTKQRIGFEQVEWINIQDSGLDVSAMPSPDKVTGRPEARMLLKLASFYCISEGIDLRRARSSAVSWNPGTTGNLVSESLPEKARGGPVSTIFVPESFCPSELCLALGESSVQETQGISDRNLRLMDELNAQETGDVSYGVGWTDLAAKLTAGMLLSTLGLESPKGWIDDGLFALIERGLEHDSRYLVKVLSLSLDRCSYIMDSALKSGLALDPDQTDRIRALRRRDRLREDEDLLAG